MNYPKAAFFDTQVEAAWASEDYTAEELAKIDRMLDLGRIGRGMTVLEPGCGTGRLTRILAERVGPQGRVLAMDISAKMIQACLRTIEPMGHVEALCAAVEEYPLPRASFDAVVCHQVFPHFDDKSRVLDLFAHALVPSGVLIVFHFINSAVINDVHLVAHAAVANDFMLPEEATRYLFRSAGFMIDMLKDDENGYLLISHVSVTS
jgi:ubiquinone/menaquinone biosynthesis C-methylase UbiE